MDTILQDISEKTLKKVIEENMYALKLFARDWPGTEIRIGREVSWCITDYATPVCNAAFHTKLTL